MQKKRFKINSIYCVLLAVLLLLSFFIGFSPPLRADSIYSDVLKDLQIDSNFNVDNYPLKNDDYSLQVIQIAESVDNELFIYVYQPAKNKIQATSVNISTAINESLNYVNYKLNLINQNNTLYKYKVKDFIVKQDALRYYDISSIFRKVDSTIDIVTDENDNTKTEISYSVGKLYTASTVNGVVSYTCLDTEIITITDKYVGFVRYLSGFKLYTQSCDSHYVAFATDKSIDSLMEADVYYVSRSARGHINLTGTHVDEYGEAINNYIQLNYTQVADNSADGIFYRKYTWNRIEKVSEFVVNEELTDDTKNALSDKDWVLRFAETDYNSALGINGVQTITFTEVTDVTILRLKFETNGIVYNLGVVDNKQSGDIIPDNISKLSLLEKIFYSILILICVLLLIPFLPYIIKFIILFFKYLFLFLYYIFKCLGIAIYYIFKYLFLSLLWIICLPVRLIRGY